MEIVKSKKGFVILFAVVIASVMMLIAVGIFSISLRETALASQTEESMRALMIADSVMDCALYYDLNSTGNFGTTFFASTENGWSQATKSKNISCGESSTLRAVTDISVISDVDESALYGKFWFRPFFGDDAVRGCGFALITKTKAGKDVQSEITSVGYNVCINNQPDISNPILLERRLYTKYQQ